VTTDTSLMRLWVDIAPVRKRSKLDPEHERTVTFLFPFETLVVTEPTHFRSHASQKKSWGFRKLKKLYTFRFGSATQPGQA
jgi:hypothetical protein